MYKRLVLKLKDGFVLYHGSYCEVKEPDLAKCAKRKDFGDGTENYRRTPETVTMEIHFNLKPIPELGTIERGSGSHKLENLSKFNLF